MAGQIAKALLPVLTKLWSDAWAAGAAAAGRLAPGGSVKDQELQDMLSGLGAKWAAQIAQTTIGMLAKVLAAGGATLDTLKAVLADADHAAKIAATEVTRVAMAAAQLIYQRADVQYVRWVTRSGNPCASCIKNAEAGRWPLGVPFPSGDVIPPGHIRCECEIVPD